MQAKSKTRNEPIVVQVNKEGINTEFTCPQLKPLLKEKLQNLQGSSLEDRLQTRGSQLSSKLSCLTKKQ